MKHVGLILARSGSQSIPDKNIFPINGIPLIGYCLKVLDSCDFLDEIWVSTNDNQIAEISHSFSPRVQIHFRSEIESGNGCSSLKSVKNFLSTHEVSGALYLVQCTSPCLNKIYLKQAFDLISYGPWNSVFAVTKSHHLRWSPKTDCGVMPVNFNPAARPRRQDWPGEMVESGHFYVTKTSVIFENNLLQCSEKSTIVEIPSCMSLELDEPWQIPFVELMVKLYYEIPILTPVPKSTENELIDII